MGKKFPRCKVRRCSKPAKIAGYCNTHALKEADKRVSAAIRGEGRCYGQRSFWRGPTFPCSGPLQCCHLFSRRYRNIRWDMRNVVPLCCAHHRWLDTNPIEKDDMMLEWLEMDYETLRLKALDQSVDWRDILAAELTEEDDNSILDEGGRNEV